MVYGRYIFSEWVSEPTSNWGAPPCTSPKRLHHVWYINLRKGTILGRDVCKGIQRNQPCPVWGSSFVYTTILVESFIFWELATTWLIWWYCASEIMLSPFRIQHFMNKNYCRYQELPSHTLMLALRPPKNMKHTHIYIYIHTYFYINTLAPII